MTRPLPVLAAVALLLAASGCQSKGGGEPDKPAPTKSPAVRTGGTFLDAGECSTRGRSGFAEVSCTSERAYARVTARYHGDRESGARCAEVTDFILDLTQHTAGKTGSDPDGYACMRKLDAPHPGDPGAGGGPYTVLGDCVHRTTEGRVRETACDGSGEDKPEFRIVKSVPARNNCPKATALYVTLPGPDPVGCARKL
ncbi:hypothetical protein AB0M28_27965 [Streptomyces sp. NPDC051940]|uniref:hypothetical protein n=1 Tax=Streptomyces sp. NPDC051940 TaxID=3155675 RepID=UPI003431446E